MTPSSPARFRAVREAFLEVLDLDAGERQARLAEFAAADPALAEGVARLIEADGRAEGFLEGSAGEFAPEVVRGWLAARPAAEDGEAGTVGPYRLLELLGRGGMGEVYLAERGDGQFEQRVAVKLLKRGMDSEEILGRFLRERQILARLEHPGIARLLDGGLAGDGRPYFVLERVEGEPITDWCRRRQAPLALRLSLIASCCDAADAAHRQLVVHRDLKPSNVLVTATGEVKLLDFGIAKLLGGDDGATALTRLDDRVLTPAYAAPEQILGEPVTTATDVYALGVMLFELLTGRLPHEREAVSAAALPGVVERETAERPSIAVRRLPEPEAGRAPGLPQRERRRLSQRLAGDLDTIVLKALQREPARRYASAAALAEDLRRHLAGKPVRARPDTLRYRARKFVGRHKVAVISAALVVLSLVGGLAAAAFQARRAAVAAAEARANSLRAERVKEFLIGLFETADPEQAAGGSVTAKELLEQAGKRLETELAGDPLIRADLLEAVARIDKSLGLLEPAEALAERAIELRTAAPGAGGALGAASLASARATLGLVRMGQGRLEEAAELLHAAHERLEASEPRQSLTLARVRSDYAQVLFWQSRVAEAEALERRVYDTYREVLGADHVLTATHHRNVGVLLEELDRLDEAEAAYRQSQAVLERALGTDHVSAAQSYLTLAVLLERRGELEEAERLFLRTFEVRQRRLGPDHPTTGQFHQLYGLFLLNRGRLDEAETHYRRAYEIFRAINPEHFEVGKCLNGLALIASRRGDHAAAEATLRQVVSLFRAVLGEDHPFTWQATGNLANAIREQGRLAEAEALEREVLERLTALTGAESGETAQATERLAETLRRAGRAAEAEAFAARAREIRGKAPG